MARQRPPPHWWRRQGCPLAPAAHRLEARARARQPHHRCPALPSGFPALPWQREMLPGRLCRTRDGCAQPAGWHPQRQQRCLALLSPGSGCHRRHSLASSASCRHCRRSKGRVPGRPTLAATAAAPAGGGAAARRAGRAPSLLPIPAALLASQAAHERLQLPAVPQLTQQILQLLLRPSLLHPLHQAALGPVPAQEVSSRGGEVGDLAGSWQLKCGMKPTWPQGS